MTEQTIKERFVNWLKELWGEEEILMGRTPSSEVNFELKVKK